MKILEIYFCLLQNLFAKQGSKPVDVAVTQRCNVQVAMFNVGVMLLRILTTSSMLKLYFKNSTFGVIVSSGRVGNLAGGVRSRKMDPWTCLPQY